MPPRVTMHSESTPSREKWIPLKEQLPVVRAEDYPQRYRQRNTNLSDLARIYDYAVNAPIRAGVDAYRQDFHGISPEVSALSAMVKQYFKKPEDAPSWDEVAEGIGLSPMSLAEAGQRAGSGSYYPDVSPAQIGGFLGEMALDPTNLAGAGLAMGGVKYADDVARGVKKADDFIDVWHGSPHKFDRFSMENIGTGEGAQAFGHGLYFTDSKDIAKQYAGVTPSQTMSPNRGIQIGVGDSRKTMKLEPGTPSYHAATLLDRSGSTLKGVRKEVQGWIDNAKPTDDVEHFGKVLETLNSVNKKSDFKLLKPEKNLYKVKIPKGDYLKWDEPVTSEMRKKIGIKSNKDVDAYFAEQNRLVKKYGGPRQMYKNKTVGEDMKLNRLKEKAEESSEYSDLRGRFTDYPVDGKELYEYLVQKGSSPKEASKTLYKAGIKGIEYPAGTLSGVKGSKARNYVTFSDEGISIEDIKKLMLIGGAGLVGTQAISQQAVNK